MKDRRLLLAAWACGTLSACSIGRPLPEPTQYVVDPPPKAAVLSGPRNTEAVRMGNVRVAAPYAGSAFVYRLDDVRYASDPYHVFEADPGAMLGSGIAEWLDKSGPFGTVAQPGSAQPAAAVLEATVTELYGDFRRDRPPAAVIAVQFILIDQVSARPRVLYERTIGRRIPLRSRSPDALAQGYGIALAEILSQLTTELANSTAIVGEHQNPYHPNGGHPVHPE
jgi:uncharacterized lipoprotein YmbA